MVFLCAGKAMSLRVLSNVERRLALSAAVLLIGGLASGCSSDTARFSDSLFTGSTRHDTVVRPPASQPYPGDDVGTRGSIDRTSTGTVSSHSDFQPVTTSALPPVGASRSAGPASRETMTSHRVASVEPVTSVRPSHEEAAAAPQPQASHSKGWSRAGGTQITTGPGDTVYSLSRRFGVPVKDILAANDLRSASALRAGQKIVIPTYHSGGTRTADARAESPSHDRPTPSLAPQHVAVLPQSPRLKEKDHTQTASNVAPTASVPKEARREDTRSHETASASRSGTGSYTVASGDSLYAIAKKTGVNVAEIKDANHLNGSMLRVGQILTIPSADGGTKVARAETAKVDPVTTSTTGSESKGKTAAPDEAKVSGYTPPHKADKVIASVEEDNKATAPDATGIGKMRWPVRGRVISAFGGGGADGDGIDISVPEGTPVKAAENGVVIYAGNGLKEFGNTVLVRHEDGLVTVYGHAKKLDVARGDKVRRGQEIAVSGMSGNADSPKLHFEVRKNSTPVDPRKYLE